MSFEWADDPKSIVAVMTYGLVCFAENIDYYVNELRPGISTQFPIEEIDDSRWLLFYRSRKDVFSSMIHGIEECNPLMSASDIHPDVELLFKDNGSFIRGPLEPRAKQLVSMIGSGSYNEPTKLSLGWRFFFQVMLPCWMLYGESHGMLFRKARCGDLDSIEKLLNLDRVVVGDRLFSRQVASFGLNSNSEQFQQILRAMGRDAKVVPIRKTKVIIAALVYRLAEAVELPVSYPKVRELFDVRAMQSGKGEIDTDLHDSDESFRTAVKRDLEFWKCWGNRLK